MVLSMSLSALHICMQQNQILATRPVLAKVCRSLRASSGNNILRDRPEVSDTARLAWMQSDQTGKVTLQPGAKPVALVAGDGTQALSHQNSELIEASQMDEDRLLDAVHAGNMTAAMAVWDNIVAMGCLPSSDACEKVIQGKSDSRKAP